MKKIGIINGIFFHMIYSFQYFQGRWWLFPFYIYSICCKRLANRSLCGCVYSVCLFTKSHIPNIPYLNDESSAFLKECVLMLVLPFKQEFLSILILISKFQYSLPCWYGMSTIWNNCFHFHRISILGVDHRRVDYIDSILVQCDATLWHGYSIKSDSYYTRINGIQSNNHAIQWNIWLNTSINVIATI